MAYLYKKSVLRVARKRTRVDIGDMSQNIFICMGNFGADPAWQVMSSQGGDKLLEHKNMREICRKLYCRESKNARFSQKINNFV